MTRYNSKGKLAATYPYIKGNLNNSNYKGFLNIRNKRALVSSPIFKLRDRDFTFCRYYTTGPSQVNIDWLTKTVNEYNSYCFYISIYKSNKLKLGEGVTLVFYISLKDEKLIQRLHLALGDCGQILKRNDSFIFRVQDSLSINEKIIPIFNKSCLQGRKLVAFKGWKKVAYLKSEGAHMTLEGLNEIKKIKRDIGNTEITSEFTKIKTEVFSLVLYGSNLSSTVGSRYTSIERALINIPTNKLSVFIGIILSDATLQKGERGDARLQFKQKYSQFEYFYSVFFQLSHYCSKSPYVTKAILHKKVHYGLGFTTRSLPCITKLHHLFYKEKKIIPENLFDLLTWEALVHWVSGDGTYSSGVTLQTQCFTVKELVLIVNVLIIKFGLECNIHKQDNYSVLYIKSKSIKKNLHNMLPYIHPTMLYKFMGPKSKLKSKYTTIG